MSTATLPVSPIATTNGKTLPSSAPQGIIHCGKIRKSPFCPDCGAKLQAENPAHQLIAMLRSKVASAEAKIANPQTVKRDNTPIPPDKIERSVSSATKTRDRFKQYLETALALSGMEESDVTISAESDGDDEVDDV